MAERELLTMRDPDGIAVFLHRWSATDPKAVVHIVHGLGEHSARYDRLAQALTAAGYHVYADDHRGHGRTGVEMGGLGPLGPRGMVGTLDSVHAVSQYARREHPGLPLVLLGHSWGSMLAQKYVMQWPDELAALILTGTRLMVPPFSDPSHFNDEFAPAATDYDWLSRDVDEVSKYVDDPWCGFSPDFPQEEMVVLAGAPTDAVSSTLPILVMNGSRDPVGGEALGHALVEAYRGVGVEDVSFICYLDARHEVFNETNRADVTEDLLEWLDARIP